MTCLPTTRDGYMWALGHFVGDQVFARTIEQAIARQAWIDANPGKPMPNPYSTKPQDKQSFKTLQDSLDLIKARVAARKG